jgi:hypothetical protein
MEDKYMIPLISKAKQNIEDALFSILNDKEAVKLILEKRDGEKIRQDFTEKSITLLSFDVDKIKDFVFTSTKPLEIQGASEIVRDIEQYKSSCSSSVYKILRGFSLGKSNVLFAGGGTGLLIVPSDKAKGISDEIELRFAESSITGSCSVVSLQLYPHELITGFRNSCQQKISLPPGVSIINGGNKAKFGDIIRILADQLGEKKDSKLISSLPLLPGFLRVCESCGIRTAVEYDNRQREWLCQSCSQHRQRGRNEQKKHSTAEDINQIAGEELGDRRYVAVIYADANGMGEVLFNLETMEEYAVFSQAVSCTMQKVREDLVKTHDLEYRYQAPIIGGDDILIIIPASKVTNIVSDLMSRVKEEFRSWAYRIESSSLSSKLQNLTMSVGFVVVPSHFNIRFSVDYAEALLNTAKEAYRSRKNGNKKEYIDWMVIKEGSPLSANLKNLRENALVRKSIKEHEWKLELTDKPVTLDRFNEIRGWIKLLKRHGISKSQLRNIQTYVERESPRAAILNTRYQWSKNAEWREFFTKLGNSTTPLQSHEKWIKEFVMREIYPGQYKTGFIDMMELYEFNGGSNERSEDHPED